MKKTKLLMPILGVGAIAATVAPMVAITGCNKEEEAAIKVVSIRSDNYRTFFFTLKYTKYIEKHSYSMTDVKYDDDDEVSDFSFSGFEEKNTGEGWITLASPVESGKSKKVTVTMTLMEKNGKNPENPIGPFTFVLNCVGKVK
ncbi:MAG: hypothetical protein ACOQNV_03300 [Mycoplasmoidaceae bacterium]